MVEMPFSPIACAVVTTTMLVLSFDEVWDMTGMKDWFEGEEEVNE